MICAITMRDQKLLKRRWQPCFATWLTSNFASWWLHRPLVSSMKCVRQLRFKSALQYSLNSIKSQSSCREQLTLLGTCQSPRRTRVVGKLCRAEFLGSGFKAWPLYSCSSSCHHDHTYSYYEALVIIIGIATSTVTITTDD